MLLVLGQVLERVVGLGVGEVVISLGDAHIYSNHREQVATQLARTPGAPPRLVIHRCPPSLFEYKFDDFELQGYAPQPPIAAPVAV